VLFCVGFERRNSGLNFVYFVEMKTVIGIVVLAFAGNLLFVNCEEKKDDKDKKDVGTVIGIDLGTTYSW
jgi:hypothetical protein